MIDIVDFEGAYVTTLLLQRNLEFHQSYLTPRMSKFDEFKCTSLIIDLQISLIFDEIFNTCEGPQVLKVSDIGVSPSCGAWFGHSLIELYLNHNMGWLMVN